MAETTQILVGTRKGAWSWRDDGNRGDWTLEGPLFLGQIISHWVQDPRAPNVQLMAAKTGHLGPTVFRSLDGGATWTEAARPPAFPKSDDPKARSVDHSFWLEPGHAGRPRVWWAGTSLAGLFVGCGPVAPPGIASAASTTMRCTTSGCRPGELGHARRAAAQPDRHRPARCGAHVPRHLHRRGVREPGPGGELVALEQGGAGQFHARSLSRVRPGRPLHRPGARPPRPGVAAEPIAASICPRPARRDLGARHRLAMPSEIGDVGIHHHPRIRAIRIPPGCSPWTARTCGRETSPGGRPAVYRTRDAGASWTRQDRGFPTAQGWFTVKRQAFCADDRDPAGLYLGTTGGEVWMSGDEGESWRLLGAHLPEIYSVSTAPAA